VPSALDPPPTAADTSRSGPEAAGEWSPPVGRPPIAARPPTASATNDLTDPQAVADTAPEVGSPLQAKTGEQPETVLDREIEMASSMAADAMLEKKKVFEEAMKATLRLRRGTT
jgi:hypothetical protein